MRRPSPAEVVLALGMLVPGVAAGASPRADSAPPCTDGALEATVALHYDERTVGEVGGLFLQVAYPEGASIPGKGTDRSVRSRIAALLEPRFRLVAVGEDGDADGREDRVRILVASTTRDAGPAAPAVRIRFDCEGQPPAAGFRCTTDQVADGAGQLLRATEAAQVTCDVRFTATPGAPAPPR